jgi:hypothetical protein
MGIFLIIKVVNDSYSSSLFCRHNKIRLRSIWLFLGPIKIYFFTLFFDLEDLADCWLLVSENILVLEFP